MIGVKKKSGKLLGGEPPRQRRARARKPANPSAGGALLVLTIGFFVIAAVAGFGWSQDRQIRGGILKQRVEASARPDWVPLESLPSYVPEAFLAVVQPSLLVAGAVSSPLDESTLARRLVHQVQLLPNSLAGEAQEIVMGPLLARRLTTNDLEELYLNRYYAGSEQGYSLYGIWHAAHGFLDEEPQDLTLSEAATLAGLLLPPRIDNPRGRSGPVGLRRNEVLGIMLEGNVITDAQYQAAMAEPLAFQPGLEQMPMTRPVDWGSEEAPIRLPENLRPVPSDSATTTR